MVFQDSQGPSAALARAHTGFLALPKTQRQGQVPGPADSSFSGFPLFSYKMLFSFKKQRFEIHLE